MMRQLSTIHGMWTEGVLEIMKSQDVLLLFKLTSLHAQEEGLSEKMESGSSVVGDFVYSPSVDRVPLVLEVREPQGIYSVEPRKTEFQHFEPSFSMEDEDSWEGWVEPVSTLPLASWSDGYSLRSLSAALGLSKSEISNAMARCRTAGMLVNDYDTGLPKVNRRELLKITEHALKYFFPVKPGAMVRGIPTGFAAPVLSKSLKSAGSLILVWPDAQGAERGQAVEPLYKTVPQAVKQDRTLYHYLALVDAIRLGGPREGGVATRILKAGMGLT